MLKLALDLSQILSCLENKIWLKKKGVRVCCWEKIEIRR